jgi:uncharacterized coiled-coil protein SlyX
VRSILLFVAAVTGITACARSAPSTEPSTREPPRAGRVVRETVTVRDASLERRVARLELQLMEKDAQIDALTTRLSDTRDEVVRTMSRLQTTTSRAEAASGVAEAEVALQTLRATPGALQLAELNQIAVLVRRSSQEFNRQNFGGALYLATQAKAQANAARGRLSSVERGETRPGETFFEVPLQLKATSRGNVREGPGTTFPVLFSVDAGSLLTGTSYADDWVRVTDGGGRSGWIFRNLVDRP